MPCPSPGLSDPHLVGAPSSVSTPACVAVLRCEDRAAACPPTAQVAHPHEGTDRDGGGKQPSVRLVVLVLSVAVIPRLWGCNRRLGRSCGCDRGMGTTSGDPGGAPAPAGHADAAHRDRRGRSCPLSIVLPPSHPFPRGSARGLHRHMLPVAGEYLHTFDEDKLYWAAYNADMERVMQVFAQMPSSPSPLPTLPTMHIPRSLALALHCIHPQLCSNLCFACTAGVGAPCRPRPHPTQAARAAHTPGLGCEPAGLQAG